MAKLSLQTMSTLFQPSVIYSGFRQSAARHPDKLALVTGTTNYTYRELLLKVDAMAAGLSAAGIRVGQHVGVLLPNCPEFVILLLAGARIGAVIVPQSIGLSAQAISSTFMAADVSHLIVWFGLVAHVEDFPLAVGSVRIVVGGAAAGWIQLQTIIDNGDARPQNIPELPLEQPFLMVLTSGSTGLPKPILLSQQTKKLRALAAAELYGVTATDITLAATPLYHSLAQRLVLLPLISGGTSVVMEHFATAKWIDMVLRHGITFSIAVSSQLKQILAALTSADEKLPSLRCLVSSSALLAADTKVHLLAHLSCEFHECYGASEIAIATNLSPDQLPGKLGSVGTAAPNTNILILGDDGQPARTGEPGEILCRTPMLFSGYYAQAGTTAAAMRDDYFRTGDLGKLDKDGYLFYLGRLKDIIITGGINVYPKDIEDVISSHPSVRECAAIALEDDQLGEVVGVVIAVDDLDAKPDLRELKRLCMQRLGDHQQPRRLFVIGELPKNAMGKLDKIALRKAYSTKTSQGQQ